MELNIFNISPKINGRVGACPPPNLRGDKPPAYPNNYVRTPPKKGFILYLSFLVCLMISTVVHGASLELITSDSLWSYSVEDTIDFQLIIHAPGEEISGLSIYLTFDEQYFQPIYHGANNDSPFVQGDFLDGLVVENDTHGDPGNGIPGFQLNYSEVLLGGSATGEGVAAYFSLVATAAVDSTLIVFNNGPPPRITQYTSPGIGGLQFSELITHTLTIGDTTSVEHRPGLPDIAGFFGNYPNPFNPATCIYFTVAEATDCQLAVFDLTGRKLFFDSIEAKAGINRYHAVFDFLPSGVFFVSLSVAGYSPRAIKICRLK